MMRVAVLLVALVTTAVPAADARWDATPTACPWDAAASAPPTYASARARAIAEGKPLVVWAGTGDVVYPACMATLTEAIHHVTPTFPGVTTSAIVVSVPEGGELWRVATITQWVTGDATWGHVPSTRRALRRWRESRHVTASGWSLDPPAMIPFVLPSTTVPMMVPMIRPAMFRRSSG